MSARIAGFAVLAAEAAAAATRGPSKPGVCAVMAVVQILAILWATDRRSAALLRSAVPAALTGVTVTAVWTALAFVVPAITTGNTAALAAIVAAGLVVAGASRRSAGRQLLPLTLVASASTALLLFLVIEVVLPGVPGFVSNNHPPIYARVTRMVDPIGELGIFVLLTVALGVDLMRVRTRTRRAAARRSRPGYGTGPNEMVVQRTAAGVQPAK